MVSKMKRTSYPISPTIEFVITVPEPYGAELASRARARMTLGVLTQLVAQAERYLVIAAPYIQGGGKFRSSPLGVALQAALQRGIDIDVVSTSSGLQALNIGTLRRIAKGKLRFFQPSANVADERELGSHAKFFLADGSHAYIGSANLTGRGLSGNLEMGVLVHGELAQQVEQFWLYLLEMGFVTELRI